MQRCLLPVLFKWYSAVLCLLAAPCLNNLQAPQFAFRSGHQVHEQIFILRRLIEISCEWHFNWCFLDGDIHKAFDTTNLSLALDGLMKVGVDPMIASAWAREYAALVTSFSFGGHELSRPVKRASTLPQGWTRVLNSGADQTARRWPSLQRNCFCRCPCCCESA